MAIVQTKTSHKVLAAYLIVHPGLQFPREHNAVTDCMENTVRVGMNAVSLRHNA